MIALGEERAARSGRRLPWLSRLALAGCLLSGLPLPGQAAQDVEPGTADWVAGVDPPRSAAQNLPEGEAITVLEPMRLRRGLAEATLVRLGREAETAYLARDFKTAHHLYQQLVALDRAHPGAWFRLGTIHQQVGDLQAASDAYRRALLALADADPAAEGVTSLRARALLNLALIGHWRARLALAELERLPGDPSLEAQRQQIERDLLAVEHRLATEGRRWPQVPMVAAVGAGARPRAQAAPMTSAGPAAVGSNPSSGAAGGRAPAASVAATSTMPRAAPSGPIEGATSRHKVEHLQGLPDRPPGGTAAPTATASAGPTTGPTAGPPTGPRPDADLAHHAAQTR